MAATLPRGIGTEAEINQANQFMREQPWYQDLLRSWGQTGNVHLNDAQKKQLLNEARVRGIGISDRFEIDPAGNINPVGHKLRNAAIIAGIAAGGYFAAPAIAGALSSGAAAGGAGAAGAGATGAGVGLGETAATLGLASGAGIGGAVAAPVAAGALGAGASAIPGLALSSTPYTGAVGATTASAYGGGAGSGILGTAGKVAAGYKKVGGILNAAGDLAQGRAEGRAQESVINQAQDRNAISATSVNLGAGPKRGAQAVQGDVLANAKPFRFTGSTHMVGNIPVPDAEGGLSPSLFSDSTRKLGTQLSSDALTAQQTDHGNPASLTPIPQAGTFDKILSTAGTIGSLYDAYSGGNNGWMDALKRYGRRVG